MTIIAVVDDTQVDRYTVKRRLSKSTDFDDVLEFDAGDTFLRDYFSPLRLDPESREDLIVLMDINMPRMDGFETVAEMELQLMEGNGIKSCVVMMYSSSDNPADRERAAQLDLVKGYIVKPFGLEDVPKIKKIARDLA